MCQDPVPHESGGHGDADLTALQLADRQRFQPAPVRRLTHFFLEAATYPRPLLIQRTAHRHAHQLLLQRPAGSAVRLPEIFDRFVQPGDGCLGGHLRPWRSFSGPSYQQRTGHAQPTPSRKKVGLCRRPARISHEHFGRSAVTHCPRGHNVQARPGCTGQNLSLSAKLKPLPFTIHIFRVTGCRGGRLQVLFRRSPNFHHRLPAIVRRRSFYFSPASRQSRHREMLIGPGLADNRIEKRTTEKANFVLESTRRSTKGRLERGTQ